MASLLSQIAVRRLHSISRKKSGLVAEVFKIIIAFFAAERERQI
jgi:hypothetical protein